MGWWLSASAESAGPFIVSTLPNEGPVTQVLLPGYFRRADRADLAVVSVTEGRPRTIRLHAMDDAGIFSPRPVRQGDFDPGAVVIDTGRLGERDVIVWIAAGRVIAYDPFQDAVRELARGPSIYSVPMRSSLPRINFFRDLNDDGLDDLVIPDFEGHRVHVQQEAGTFSAPVQMRAPPVMDMSINNHPWYQPLMLFETDVTSDGRTDVVFWVDEIFRVYPQLESGGFSGDPLEFTSSVAFDPLGVEDVSIRISEADQSDLRLTTLYRLGDLDGNGKPELVTLTIDSQGVFKKQSTYHVYSGTGKPLAFTADPTSIIASRGIQFESDERDLDGDGDVDLIVSSVRIGIGKIISALLTGSVSFDLDFYRMRDGRYPGDPDTSREITATIDLSSGDVYFPFVLIADLNRDNFAELMIQEGDETIRIYRGQGGEALFARDPIDVTLDELPNDAELVQLFDFNADGRQDVLFRLEQKGRRSRVRVLITGDGL